MRRVTKSVNKFSNEDDAKKFFAAFVDDKGIPLNRGYIRYVKVTMTYTRPNGPDNPKVWTVEVWSRTAGY